LARCTAPVRGHRTASGAAACPACGGRYRGYGGYGSYSYPSHPPLESSRGGVRSSVGGSGSSGRPRWSRVGSAVAYTPAEVRALTPVRESVEKRALLPDLRDVFLCHAWDDRRGPAKELHDLLESLGVSVWFSERTSSSARHCCAKSTRTGEVTSRDRACDPRAAAPPTRRGNRRQRAIGTPSTRPARSRRARHDI